jgi:hypothetical protein
MAGWNLGAYDELPTLVVNRASGAASVFFLAWRALVWVAA